MTNRISIPLASTSDADSLKAVDLLTSKLGPEITENAQDFVFLISFDLNGKAISEHQFFSDIQTKCANPAPALRKLIERYMQVADPHTFLFSDAEGVGLLASAIRALGTSDLNSLPLLKQYSLLVDRGHEYVFAGETTPAIAEAHGWRDETVAFVLWVAACDFYNTVQPFKAMWIGGMREATAKNDPMAFAQQVTEMLFDDSIQPTRPRSFGTSGLKRFAANINNPDDAWANLFMTELLRLVAEKTGDK